MKEEMVMSRITSEEVKNFVSKKVNSNFFKKYVPDERSAYSFLNFSMQVDVTGKMAEVAQGIMRPEIKEEIDKEGRVIEAENDIHKLYNMLRKPISVVNVYKLIEKLMCAEDKVIPRLLEDIKKSGNDSFVEAAVRILAKCSNNYSKELAEILAYIKYPYTQALMCYTLGKIGGEEHIETVYNFFTVLKNNYVNENYFEGPLLGLYELSRRYEF